MCQSHYEILGVERTASTADIKAAYLRLSKKYHPDVDTTDPELHAKFVRVREAYSILSKSSTRTYYDLTLDASQSPHYDGWIRTDARGGYWRDESLYHMRNRADDAKYKRRGYYGNSRWLPKEKVSNMTIVTASIGLLIVGSMIHVLAANILGERHRKHLDEQDKRLAATYSEIRKEANGNSMDEQIRKVWDRMNKKDDE